MTPPRSHRLISKSPGFESFEINHMPQLTTRTGRIRAGDQSFVGLLGMMPPIQSLQQHLLTGTRQLPTTSIHVEIRVAASLWKRRVRHLTRWLLTADRQVIWTSRSFLPLASKPYTNLGFLIPLMSLDWYIQKNEISDTDRVGKVVYSPEAGR